MHDTTQDISLTFIGQLQHMRHLQSRVLFLEFSIYLLYDFWHCQLGGQLQRTPDSQTGRQWGT